MSQTKETSELLYPPEILEGPRILLRKTSVVDAEDIFRNYAQDEVVTQFLPWEPHQDIHASRRFLQECNEQWRDGRTFCFGILLKEHDHVIGMISMRPKGHNVDVGYVLARAFWGQGIMTEALTVLSNWCLQQPKFWRVEAYCDVDNKASARVMERAGMEREGLLRNYMTYYGRGAAPKDAFFYSRVKTSD